MYLVYVKLYVHAAKLYKFVKNFFPKSVLVSNVKRNCYINIQKSFSCHDLHRLLCVTRRNPIHIDQLQNVYSEINIYEMFDVLKNIIIFMVSIYICKLFAANKRVVVIVIDTEKYNRILQPNVGK